MIMLILMLMILMLMMMLMMMRMMMWEPKKAFPRPFHLNVDLVLMLPSTMCERTRGRSLREDGC